MAEVAGKSGRVSFTSFQTSIKSFTLNHVSGIEDITDFQDGTVGYKKYKATLKDWTCSFEGSWDAANTATIGAEALVSLYLDGTSYYTGSAILLSVDITSVVSGIVTGTGSFQGNGALTLN